MAAKKRKKKRCALGRVTRGSRKGRCRTTRKAAKATAWAKRIPKSVRKAYPGLEHHSPRRRGQKRYFASSHGGSAYCYGTLREAKHEAKKGGVVGQGATCKAAKSAAMKKYRAKHPKPRRKRRTQAQMIAYNRARASAYGYSAGRPMRDD